MQDPAAKEQLDILWTPARQALESELNRAGFSELEISTLLTASSYMPTGSSPESEGLEQK
jgi:hypothetical protein